MGFYIAAPKTPDLPVSISVNDITIDTSNSVDIIDGSSDLESVLKFRVQASALNMWGSTSSTHLLTLIDTTDGSVVGTDNVTLTFGIDGFDFFDVNTLTAPTSRNNYATKLANALNGYTMTIGVVPTFLTSATFASTATSIAFVGTAEVSFTASVNASDNVEVAMKVTDLDVTSDRIVQGGANQQGLSVTFAGAITTNAQFGNSSINNDESVTFVQQEFKTFKAGETHSFGIVFEDLYGRSTGVQELGSIKVPTLGERAAGSLGAAHMDITASVSGLDSNLTRFFYVYSGGNTISDYVQYSVSAAFVPEATNISKGNSDSIYVGLRTLQGKDQSYSGGGGADISYTFTEGDKLRILSYLDSSGARVYPDNYTFDVVGLESLDSDIFGSSLNDIEVTGDFLILKDSSQAGFSRAAVVGASDSWGEDVVVEIYTPKKEQTTKIYKAIEGKYDIADLGTTHTITQGNAWFKQRNIKFVDGSDPKKLTNNLMYVESIQYSDYDKNTKGILGGKPYAIINNEREQNRISSITYSDPQLADSAQNNLKH